MMVKTRWHIAFLFLWVCLSACTQGVVETRHGTSLQSTMPSSALSSIDSLLWVQPDSALTCLLPYFDTCCRDAKFCVSTSTEYDRHYAHLLLSELLYKNDYAQTNRAELLDVVAYFDSLCCRDAQRASAQNIAFLDARAHYINGAGYYEHDSVVPACKEYLKALEVMEEHFEEKELVGKKAKFMALTYTHLSNVYSDQYLHEQVIYFGKSALAYYQKYDAEPWHVAWMMNLIGSRYDILENYDSAYYYYNQGQLVLPDTNCLMYRDIATHLAFLAYEMKVSSLASINQLHKLINQADGNLEYTSRCLTLGEIYYEERRFDSAWHYLNIVYKQTQSVALKKQAAEWLVEIGEAQGEIEESSEYAKFLVPYANIEEYQSSIKSQLAELYNVYRQSILRQHQRNEVKYLTKQLFFAAIVLLFVILLVIIILHLRNKRQQKELEMQIEAERHSHQMQQAALAGRLKRSNAALKEQSLTNVSKVLPAVSSTNKADNFVDEPICQHILAVCNDKSNPIKSTVPVEAYVSIALSDIQKAELKDAALRHYSRLFEILRNRYPQLKEKDFLYCHLCLLGLGNAQIAALLQNSTSTVWERENRLKKILGSEDKVSVTLYGLMIN